MKHRLIWGLLAAMALATVAAPARAVDEDAIKMAIEKGVTALRGIQIRDGTFPHTYNGATSLAGLALLECGAAPDDEAVVRAADAVRKASIASTHTYSISLAIMFLDRLGDPEDVPLIESLVVRLLAGQDPKSGGWTYDCPRISNSEVKRLEAQLKDRKGKAGRREASPPPAKRKVEDLAPEIQDQLRKVARGEMIAEQVAQAPGVAFPGPDGRPLLVGLIPGDNSNTQFAALALWVGRRHGLPVANAIKRLETRFRTSQMEDGGWTYVPITRPPGMPAHVGMPVMGSTAAMTCAGVLSLAICDGAVLEYAREQKPDAKLPDVFTKDQNLARGLEALGAVIDDPKSLKPPRGYHPHAPQAPENSVGGRTYYFLWSLERVAMALDLKTIGKKDWYGWGAEILLENQQVNGTWAGDHAEGGVDTAFALLFLKRANLARDLTAQIKGAVKDPGERVLRGAASFDKSRRRRMRSGIETLNSKPITKPAPKSANAESAGLADAVLKAKPSLQMELLEKMESEKGVKYTEALAAAIPSLEGDSHRRAREALANRLTRMKDETLAEYLQDDEAEIRRAAAIAIGQKESKALVPNLIGLLNDPETSVVRAAHASLKELTEQDFGPGPKATRDERDKAVLKWIEWWSKQRKKSTKE